MDEAQLVARMKPHDRDAQDALGELMELYEDSLTYMARGLLHDPRDAEEAVVDTFVKAFTHARTYRADARVCAWLKTICHNTCVTRRRRKRLHLVSYDDLAARDANYLTADRCHEQACEARIDLQEGLRELREAQREAVVLIGIADLTFDEAARAVGVAASTLKSRYHAGMRRLAEMMAEPREADGA